MQLEVGAVFEGTVTGITKFGAFVSLPEGKSGLVHISEIANTYVSDVRDHLQEGAAVKVKVIGIDDSGRINLSIKKAEQESPPRPELRQRSFAGRREQSSQDLSFEDKLKAFMQDSDNKNSGNRLYSDKRSGRRKNK